MTLRERVGVAAFVGVVHIQSVHPSPDAAKPEEQRQDWHLQTADAVVVDTIKGADIPAHITINFDNGQREGRPNVLYDGGADYLVFLVLDIPDGFSTCEQGQYAIHGTAVSGWPGSAGPVALDVPRGEIAKVLPR